MEDWGLTGLSDSAPAKCVPGKTNETRQVEALESIAESLKQIAESLRSSSIGEGD